MYKEVFVNDFSSLGVYIESSLSGLRGNDLLNSAFEASLNANPLFSIDMQKEALYAICEKFLNTNSLNDWLEPYKRRITERNSVVGIIMAGNLPLVGFHDFLVVLASGCKAKIKLSGKDRFLLPAIFGNLCEINTYWKERIVFTGNLPDEIDFLLATGGEESSKIFEYNYANVPKIVRTSRSSIAILNGNEEKDDLLNLSKDVFLYYGMGCRSVSTLLVPDGYSFELLVEAFGTIKETIISEDYISAYRYQKALAQMHNSWFLDGGFYILRNFLSFPPPPGVIYVINYKNIKEISDFIDINKPHIQCIVGRENSITDTDTGQTQYPTIVDYADGINSLEFLLNNI